MTIVFEDIHDNREVEIKDVKFFTTDSECLGLKGYSVHYNDGTFNLFPYDSWRLAMVRQ